MTNAERQKLAHELLNCPGMALYDEKLEELKAEALTIGDKEPAAVTKYKVFKDFKYELLNYLNPNPERDG